MIRPEIYKREGRDAVVAERLQNGPPARNPYSSRTFRARYWSYGANAASQRIDELMRIGA
ncbi:hypothetical protein [Novosphingobium guangzhouense]|uniref:Uncharacterized protein n=1 Tax=Novosphingobium guangzhouense TaxID=1850347 RepID=A0A2K2G605_9SPHN|nr:hypothetical protein [Novosphingobium guangzhouense]PNU06452.1 hypothetical protein A8V01_02595 [Novosphingobium guangzhouense]